MKQIKDNTNICKDIPCSWIRIINIAKITILYKAICIFKLIPIKLPKAFFTELESNVFYLYGNRKDPKYPKKSWERKMELEESGSLTPEYTTKIQWSKQHGIVTKSEM